jgi:hypothetical protein
MEISSSQLHTSLYWERIYKVREFSDWLMVYQNRHLAYLLPKRCFETPSDLATFKSLLQRKKLLPA